MSNPIASLLNSEASDILDVVDAAKFLRVSEKTLRTYTKSGRIPSVRLGRRLLYSRSALLEWAARQSNRGRS